VTTGTTGCEGTVQAGQLLQVNGSGFTPSSTVRIVVSSAGLGSSSEQEVAQATADSTGAISQTVRVPLAAKGFTPSGSAAGLISVDTLGTGPSASHLDDLAMLGLAPHGSACGTVDTLPFRGFTAPVANAPTVNKVQPGSTVPVKFSLPGTTGALSDVLAAGYPQSTPIDCASKAATGSATATTMTNTPNSTTGVSENQNYLWQTDRSWTGCRLLDVRLVDSSSHTAVFNFGS